MGFDPIDVPERFVPYKLAYEALVAMSFKENLKAKIKLGS
jgi:hypothetical protein